MSYPASCSHRFPSFPQSSDVEANGLPPNSQLPDAPGVSTHATTTFVAVSTFTHSQTGSDFELHAPGGIGGRGVREVREKYFDVNVERNGLKWLKMECQWKVEGNEAGRCRGQLWIALVRDGSIIANTR